MLKGGPDTKYKIGQNVGLIKAKRNWDLGPWGMLEAG